MKRLVSVLVIATLLLTGCAKGAKKNSSVTDVSVPDVNESGTIVILATGGTIAGVGEA